MALKEKKIITGIQTLNVYPIKKNYLAYFSRLKLQYCTVHFQVIDIEIENIIKCK